ncbi:hypothetical protein H5410_048357 [Solanum commersonii]|uniref:Uncharacterized protein n=1 Tax=Solanum commersonii TaxID=4109 RepID=A0A9J5XHX9_SOLCO|nr:hypothetical protein H5410_048357 [Solanum commersonii]
MPLLSCEAAAGVIELKPGEVDNITRSIMPGRNTLDCLMTLGENSEDGLCMFSQGKCVMFGWGTTLSIRHTASEIKEIYCK